MNIAHDLAAFDVNLLVALDILLREKSVTRTASRLGISQSAVSHKLRTLRELLDDEILVGARGALVLTHRAARIEEPLRAALAALAVSVDPPDAFSPLTSNRTFRVATGEVGELAIMTDALGELKRVAPNVRVEFVRPDARIQRRLEEGEVDFVIGPEIPAFPGLMRKTFLRDPIVVLMRRGHPARRALSSSKYLSLEHVNTSGENIVDAELATRNVSRNVRVRVGSPIVAAHLTSHSDLVFTTGLVFATAFARHIPSEIVPHPDLKVTIPLHLSWHRRSLQDAGAMWARTLAERLTRDLAEAAKKFTRTSKRRETSSSKSR